MTTAKGGQPSFIFDETKIENLLNYLRLGMYITQACNMSGIGESTYHKWRKIGEEADTLEPDERTDQQTAAVEFMEEVKKARAEAEAFHLRNVREAGETGSWQASAWWLERSFPERWGRKERVEVTGPDEGPLIVELEFAD